LEPTLSFRNWTHAVIELLRRRQKDFGRREKLDAGNFGYDSHAFEFALLSATPTFKGQQILIVEMLL
jgi:hypothetical protein